MREKDLSVVVSTLEEEFNIYRELEGESVPVHCQDVTSGPQKNGKEGTGRGFTGAAQARLRGGG